MSSAGRAPNPGELGELAIAMARGSLGPFPHSARRLLRVVPCLAPAAAALLMVRMWLGSRPSLPVRDVPVSRAVRPYAQSQASPEDLASAADELCAAGAPDRGEDVGGERYLLYQPQFGLSNQIVALRNAVVWALLLNRTLVLPHLLGHGTAQLRATHSSAFDVEAARAAIAPLRVEEMEPWLRLGIAPQVTRRVGAPPRPAIPRIHPAPLCTHHSTPCIHPANPVSPACMHPRACSASSCSTSTSRCATPLTNTSSSSASASGCAP